MKKDSEIKFNDMMEEFSEPQSDEQDLEKYPHGPQKFEKYVDMDMSKVKIPPSQVHNPSHYDVADTTVQKIIEASFTHEELMGWIKGNIIKYRLRAFRKGDNGVQDINKADEYQGFYNQYVKRNTP